MDGLKVQRGGAGGGFNVIGSQNLRRIYTTGAGSVVRTHTVTPQYDDSVIFISLYHRGYETYNYVINVGDQYAHSVLEEDTSSYDEYLKVTSFSRTPGNITFTIDGVTGSGTTVNVYEAY